MDGCCTFESDTDKCRKLTLRTRMKHFFDYLFGKWKHVGPKAVLVDDRLDENDDRPDENWEKAFSAIRERYDPGYGKTPLSEPLDCNLNEECYDIDSNGDVCKKTFIKFNNPPRCTLDALVHYYDIHVAHKLLTTEGRTINY
jgi:hypothetical protein